MLVKMEIKKENYYDQMERDDKKIFTRFNDDVQWFKELNYNPKGSEIDVFCIDKKGRKVHVELKQRVGRYGDFFEFVKKFDGIYLEVSKLNMFSKIEKSGYTYDEQELFASLFNDGDIIVIHNIKEPQPMQWLPDQKILDKGCNERKVEHRVGLLWYRGMIYERGDDGHYRKWTDDEIDDLCDKVNDFRGEYD